MTIIFDFLCVLLGTFVFFYVAADLLVAVRNNKYQRLWNIEKVNLIRTEANLTYPELYERYVNFCRKNECQVRF